MIGVTCTVKVQEIDGEEYRVEECPKILVHSHTEGGFVVLEVKGTKYTVYFGDIRNAINNAANFLA